MTTSSIPRPGANGNGAATATTPESAIVRNGSIRVRVGDDERVIDTYELATDDEYTSGLAEFCELAEEPPVFDLTNLLELVDNERWGLLNLISPVSGMCFATSVDPTSPFECVIELLVDVTDISRCKRGKQAAIETAVLQHSDALEMACGAIAKRFKELKVTGIRVADLLTEAKKLRAELDANDEDENDEDEGLRYKVLEFVRGIFPDAPVSDKLQVPGDWKLSAEHGIELCYDDGKVARSVAPQPVLIAGRYVDVHSGEESQELVWKRDGRWHTAIVPRNVTSNTRLIVELAAQGVPVTSNNAKDLVQWHADFEAVNMDSLPCSKITNQLGWQGKDGCDGFLLGGSLIQPDGEAVDASVAATEGAIIFQGIDEGDKQLAEAYVSAGSFEGWREALNGVAEYPRVILAMYAALIPPLLQILRVPNFLIDYCGPTSNGKTTTLRTAASVWGCPDENLPSAAIATWDATRIWFERAMSVLNFLPIIVDDTMRANKDIIGEIIYDVTAGRGRGRGTKKGGTERTSTFNTVMLLSGESPATAYTSAGGAKARVLTVWGSPFGETSSETGIVLQTLVNGILANYGHAGPAFVAYLNRNRDRWEEWRQLYAERLSYFQERAGNNTVANRMSPMFASIDVAGQLAHLALDLPWEHEHPAQALYSELIGEAVEADRAKAALKFVYDYAVSHRKEFYVQSAGFNNYQPHGGWLGRWDVVGSENHTQIAPIDFVPQQLKRILAEDFEPVAIIRAWSDRGWLRTEGNSNRPHVRIDGPAIRVVSITRQAIEAMLEEVEADCDELDEDEDNDPAGEDGDT